MTTVVKICGLTRIEHALTAARLGAHAVGVVLYRQSPRFVSNEQARRIVDALPPFVTPVALMVNPAADEVETAIEQVRPALLQFHGDESADFCSSFSLPYIKALRVSAETDLLQYARNYASAKGLLLDTFVDGARGGTGTMFDWSLIPRELPLPTILAGGLNPDNVSDAIRQVRPWAVDVSSGVEAAKGIKDAALMAAFIRGVKDADV
ncbi:MAG: phosphoribosylanthranilate isomerase [Betaproteobacteria bacterium]|nr:MAG: phosphoribosylanthranilate isomerase [Betaproteobacteria bacterium]